MSKNRIYLKKSPLICAMFLTSTVSIAEQVTFVTIENVGHGGQNDFNLPSTSFKDDGCVVEPCNGTNNLDGMAGVFAFIDLSVTDSVGNPNYYGLLQLEDKSNPNTVPFPPTPPLFPSPDIRANVFITDFAPIDTSKAQDIYTFTAGFGFTGYPFYPKTLGPSNIQINHVNDDPSELVVNTFPFAGIFNGFEFVLHPQASDPLSGGVPVCTAAPHVPLTVRWYNRIGFTDRYNYKMVWTHCILPSEDPSGGFSAQRANWIIEGVMTAPDTTPPTVFSTLPVDLLTTQPLDNPVSVTFSERMDPTTITNDSFLVSPTAGGPSECAVPIEASADLKTFTCIPAGGSFSLAVEYNIEITSATTTVTDNPEDNSDTGYVTGVALASTFTSTFTTTGPDAIPPTFISATPSADFSKVSLTFADNSGSMAAVTASAINVSTDGVLVTGTTSTTDNLTFTLTTDLPLQANSVYTVNIDGTTTETGAQDGSGNLLAGGDVVTLFSTGGIGSLPIDPVEGEPVVTVDDTAGASMVSLAIVSPSEIGGALPDRVILDDVFVEFVVNGFTDGQAMMTIDFGVDFLSEGKYIYKANGSTYNKLVEGTDYTQVNGSTIQMTITDNGPFDLDPADGIIRDPIGTGFDRGAKPVPGSLPGCSVTGAKASPLDHADMLLLLGLVLWFGLYRKRSGDEPS